MNISKSLCDCLVTARSTENEIIDISSNGVGGDAGQLHWLETQLANIIAEMEAILADVDSGLSIQHIGFSSDADFEEMIEGFEIEINNLKGKIRSLLLARNGRCV